MDRPMTSFEEPQVDGEGREHRPAFLSASDTLTIFKGAKGRAAFVKRKGYMLSDGCWRADGKPDQRDVVVRDSQANYWELVPETLARPFAPTLVA
jgi:hypothetical protein